MTVINFEKEVVYKLYAALVDEGFERINKSSVNYSINSDFKCWVSLALAKTKGGYMLIPNIGLHVVPIQKMFCEFSKGQYQKKYSRNTATYPNSLYDIENIMNEKRFYFLEDQSDSFMSSEAKRLAKIYCNQGLEYVRSIASYEKLIDLLKPNVLNLGGKPEKYALCLHFLGKNEEAKDFLESFSDDYKKYIEGFSKNFIEMIGK